ncbi:cysteine hydrolase family protein [Streptomyces sp. NPDC021093]|uniref:cysteine hydrolase family protein n=1 Tax=Streptomyces sp. NPDC021093 TaxID=3365112 RepID=UPI0037BC5AAB
MDITQNTALVVIDVQQGFEDPFWGNRNNPSADDNIAVLIDAWQSAGRPVVFVRHDSEETWSPLRPGQSGNDFKPYVEDRRGKSGSREVLVSKLVNSAFYGTPDLDAWLKASDITQFAVVGIQTNMCVETTARMGGNLGYQVILPLDATHTFDLKGPFGWQRSGDDLSRATAVSLHGGRFAEVTTTEELLKAARTARD